MMAQATAQITVVKFPIAQEGIPLEQLTEGAIIESCRTRELVTEVLLDAIRKGSVNINTLFRRPNENVRDLDKNKGISVTRSVRVIDEHHYYGQYEDKMITSLTLNGTSHGVEGRATYFGSEDEKLKEAGL